MFRLGPGRALARPAGRGDREVSDPLRRLVTLAMVAAKAHATDPVARAAGRLLAERALIRRELPPTAPWWLDTLKQLLTEADKAGQLQDLSRLVRPTKLVTPDRVPGPQPNLCSPAGARYQPRLPAATTSQTGYTPTTPSCSRYCVPTPSTPIVSSPWSPKRPSKWTSKGRSETPSPPDPVTQPPSTGRATERPAGQGVLGRADDLLAMESRLPARQVLRDGAVSWAATARPDCPQDR
jgi:hypothetical protein